MKTLPYWLIIAICTIFVCASSLAQTNNILKAISPKLRQFVTIHTKTSEVLSQVVSEAFTNRTVQLFYFYTDDDSVARAYHYYPDDSVVGICIRENQEPLDEYISLLYESLNSENEKKFAELLRKATSGEVSRTDYAKEVLRVEFTTVQRMRNLLHNLKFGEMEASRSVSYKQFIECPDSFDDFLSDTTKASAMRSPLKEYEAQYDLLHKSPGSTN